MMRVFLSSVKKMLSFRQYNFVASIADGFRCCTPRIASIILKKQESSLCSAINASVEENPRIQRLVFNELERNSKSTSEFRQNLLLSGGWSHFLFLLPPLFYLLVHLTDFQLLLVVLISRKHRLVVRGFLYVLFENYEQIKCRCLSFFQRGLTVLVDSPDNDYWCKE